MKKIGKENEKEFCGGSEMKFGERENVT